jgi:LacI family transcriptional regulator
MNTASPNISVAEIARQSNVSVPAVYQALNRSGRLNPKTRERILGVANRLGYRPNAAAKAISTGRFNCVSLLLSTIDRRSTLPDRMLVGINDALVESDIHLTLTLLPDEKLTSDGFVPKILREWMADGLLINYTDHIPSKMIGLIEQNTIPAVWMNSKQSANAVFPDDFDAGRRATEMLLKIGHKRIAYVDYSYGGDGSEPIHYSSTDRQAGYEMAMKSGGFAPRIIRPATPRSNQWERPALAKQFLDVPAKQRPTAVVTYSGTTAVPVAVAAVALGIDIPKQLSMVTFDNSLAGLTGVALTTMTVPNYELGRAAVEMLLRRIERPTGVVNCQAVPFGFVEGNSVSKPPTGS